MSKDWSSLTDRERDAALAQSLGWVLNPPNVRGLGWQTPDGRFLGTDAHPHYTQSLDAMRTVEDEIERRGLIGRYQNALISVLDLDMQVFNSAIELSPHVAPSIPNNTFEWDGHAYLWRLLHATPAQRAEAAYKTLKEHIHDSAAAEH